MLIGYPLSPWAVEDELDGDLKECLERAYQNDCHSDDQDDREEEELSVDQISRDAGIY